MYQKTVLDNGLRIVTANMPHFRSVSVNVFIGAGSRYESTDQAGISHFVEHLLFKGTEKRPTAKEISESIEGVGGILNGGTDKELSVYWAKVARPHLGLAMDVLGDIVCHSKFDHAEIEKERQVIMEEINMSMDSPQQRVNMLIDDVVWPDQPLGRDVAGSKETVNGLNRESLLHYHNNQYTPGTTVISVAGDISHDEVVSQASGILGEWDNHIAGSWHPARDEQNEPRFLTEIRDSEQSHLCLALRGLSNSHPDRFAFDLLNVVLGGGMSSRLFLELREKRGLAYDVHSYVSHFFDSGSLVIYAGVEPKNVENTIEVLLGELARTKSEDIPETEFLKAKEMAKGRLLLRMEDTRSVSGWIGGQELLREEIQTVDEMISIVDALTADDLRKVAQDSFRSGGLSLAVVGPSPPGEEKLRRLLTL